MTRALVANLGEAVLKQTTAFTDLPKIAVPNTTVVNRATMTDFANDALPKFGINRVMTQQIMEVQGESGPAGERVFKPINDIHDQVRFVGSWAVANGINGIFINSSGATTNYFEVSFYGTGLNVLIADTNSRDIRVTVDGGAESASIVPASGSSILSSRNYSPDIVLSAASGLTLGLHTVKLRDNIGNMALCGFEVLNSNSTLQLVPGSSYNGSRKLTKAALSTDAYNSNFESGTLGTRGGHVVVYQKTDGSIGKAVTPTAATSLFTTSANHTTEEVIRSYFWREFGAGRADDFSGNIDSTFVARSFTLDDGTTTLSGNGVRTAGLAADLVQFQNSVAAKFITFTFVGSGIDIEFGADGSNRPTGLIIVDGTQVSTSITIAANSRVITKIASGLPYGTHTVKLASDGGGLDSAFFSRFIVYGPLKPSLPTGAVELADYFLMADYVQSATAAISVIGSGMLRKAVAVRETVFTGTWVAPAVDSINFESGFNTVTNISASTYQLVFFGTGIEIATFVQNTVATAETITIDGATNLTVSNSSPTGGAGWAGALTTALLQVSSGITFTASTGVIGGTSAAVGRIKLRITGLTLGFHTVKVTTGNTTPMYADCFDIITPVHSQKSNGPGVIQNTLSVGSQGLNDSRKFSPQLVKPSSNWVQAVGISSAPSTPALAASPAPLPDLSATIKTEAGKIGIKWSLTFFSGAAGTTGSALVYVDGAAVSVRRSATVPVNNYDTFISDEILVPVSAGYHKVDVYWFTSAGSISGEGNLRTLVVREM